MTHAPASRPPSSAADRTIVARWATAGLLCAAAVLIGFGGQEQRAAESLARRDGAELRMEKELKIGASSAPNRAVWTPDFLEPLPSVEPTSALAETEHGTPLSEPLPFVPEEGSAYAGAEFPHEELPALVAPSNTTTDSLPIPTEAESPPSESIAELAKRSAALPGVEVNPVAESVAPIPEPVEFDEDAELAAQLTADDVLTYSPAVAEISQKMLPEVRAAFALAQHGATHAAHAKFVSVLRRIAQAKDVEAMTDRHTRALEEGLRALDEADDFMTARRTAPNVDLETIAATHQTPMLKVHQSRYTLPHEAVALYHRYAQQKLGAAVADEQAGSMALHGLGKIYARWSETEDNQVASTRYSMTMYRAALVAHPRNHLAANELGVLLARAGRYDQAVVALEWAVQLAGTATIYRNLAVVQQHRGQAALAQSAYAQSERLAALERSSGEVSRRHGIQWVAPQDFARVSDEHAVPAPNPQAVENPPAAPRQSRMTPAPRGGIWR